jgi:hypothetical protein
MVICSEVRDRSVRDCFLGMTGWDGYKVILDEQDCFLVRYIVDSAVELSDYRKLWVL